ncbi:MAG: response regulator [Thiotrichales bacterium]|jgi:CheY-like chemotaxis protein|nr:response regulator [Thiotrichales bacterium]MBT3614063.1 response regulator [Thiotrichales bacterium]MBT4260878.1 response regulator [Thiotrichales bacterium]MBT5290536.1 response regulator [Thiotrichales bacterium]MBT5417819.1 response regulator [Thiotrichales bacterium]
MTLNMVDPDIDCQDKSILIMDDDREVLNNYRQIFGLSEEFHSPSDELDELLALVGIDNSIFEDDNQCDVTMFRQGLEGIHAADQAVSNGAPYTHALIDMRMPPGIDGLKTATKLREIIPELKVIFISAYMDFGDDDLDSSLPEGYMMLKKPFTPAEIGKALEYAH